MPSRPQVSRGHTGGEWELMHAEHGQHIEIVTNDGHIGLAFAGVFSDGSTGEGNARLMRSAPALLDALRDTTDTLDGILEWLDRNQQTPATQERDCVARARAVIDQATGQEESAEQ